MVQIVNPSAPAQLDKAISSPDHSQQRSLVQRARTHASQFMYLAPGRVDHIPSFRIASGLAVPLALVLLLGRPEWAMYASFGAFTGIYWRYESTRMRVKRQSMVAVLLTLCVGIGATVAHVSQLIPLAAGHWGAMMVSALVAAGSATFIARHGLKPAGAVFPLFAVAAVGAAPAFASIGGAILIAAASAAWCVFLGFLGHWLGERHTPPGGDALTLRHTRGQLSREFVLYTGAALVAGAVGLLSGLPYPYWAQIAAIVPVSVIDRGSHIERGLHRMIGTTLGVIVAAFLLSFPSEAWQLAVWAVVLQFLAEMYVMRNYYLGLMFITPLALLMIQLAHPVPVEQMLQARVLETVIGVVCGFIVIFTAAATQPWRRRAYIRRRAAKAAQRGTRSAA